MHAICFGPSLGSFRKPSERCSEVLAARSAPQNATDIGRNAPWASQPTVPGELGRNFSARTQWNFGWMLGGKMLGSFGSQIGSQNATDIGRNVPWASQRTVPGELGRNFSARTQWNFGWMLGGKMLGSFGSQIGSQNATNIGRNVPWASQRTVPGELGRNFSART